VSVLINELKKKTFRKIKKNYLIPQEIKKDFTMKIFYKYCFFGKA